MSRPRGGLLIALSLPLLAMPPFRPFEQAASTVNGRLFVDLNANGVYDDGEPALGGIAIEFANGERIETVATAADGSFSIQVEPGLWRAALRPPEGFEYALPEGIELELLEAVEGVVELQIGLQPVQLLQVLVSALEAGAEGDEQSPPEAEPPPDSEQPTDPEVDPEVYDGPFLPSDESLDPSLLPESGSRLPPRALAVIYAGGLLGVGLLAWAAGRALEAGRRAGALAPADHALEAGRRAGALAPAGHALQAGRRAGALAPADHALEAGKREVELLPAAGKVANDARSASEARS